MADTSASVFAKSASDSSVYGFVITLSLEHVSERHTNESNHLISIAKEYIMQNLDKEQLNLEAVSDHVGLSRISIL